MLSEVEFHKNLRSALNHLYNRDYLRDSPLIGYFGLSARADAPLILQRTLLEAIQAMKENERESLSADKRLVFEILNNRYVEQFSQDEVAHQLGLSIRQFRREQDTAIAALVYHLWQKFKLDRSLNGQLKEEESSPKSELDWVHTAGMDWVNNPRGMIAELVRMIQPVADSYQVEINNKIQDPLNGLAVHPVAFRQIVLNILRIAIDWARGGQIDLTARNGESNLEIKLSARPQPAFSEIPSSDGERDNLVDIASELAQASSGRLIIRQAQGAMECLMILPVMNSIPVLVVDDNQEIIDLLTRYTLGTRFRVIGVQDPEQAIHRALAVGSRIIVLDVMMPKIDGWELLGRFRRHPETGHLPVMVLSILAQRELALSLGAKALVLKPVKQDSFLSALDQVYAQAYSRSDAAR